MEHSISASSQASSFATLAKPCLSHDKKTLKKTIIGQKKSKNNELDGAFTPMSLFTSAFAWALLTVRAVILRALLEKDGNIVENSLADAQCRREKRYVK